jgi:hypothetical protein
MGETEEPASVDFLGALGVLAVDDPLIFLVRLSLGAL